MAFATLLNRKNRLVSMLSDQVIMTMIMCGLWAPVIVYHAHAVAGENGSGYIIGLDTGWDFYAAFVFSLYFNKDVLFGQSIGKRLLRFRIINKQTGEPAGPLRCLARNLTLLMWPVELVAAMIDVRERLGDFIAGTRLENYEAEVAARPEWGKILVALLVGVAGMYVVIIYPLESLIGQG